MIYIATDNFNDGFPLSNAYDDTIYQKANGEYYLKFRFPVDRLGVWKHLTCETVLKADDTRGLQLFKIKKINKINGYIRVYAKHISDDLNFISVDKIAVNNATGRRVMEALAGSTTEQHSFIFDSDIATMHTLNLSNTTAGKVLSKDKHSILGQWGGELIRDNFLIDLKSRAGVDTEILFMNKKNVKNLDNVVSTENLTTRLKLTVEKEHEGKKQIITATVDSPNINAYPRIYTNYLKVNNNNIETQQQLIEYGNKYFKDSLVDFPTDNLTVNVIDKNQEQINLFDTVWFRNVDFNIDKRLKVVAYEYSPMAKRYKKISFGALKVANLGQIKSLSQLEEKIDEKITESFTDAFKIQKNLSELLKLDRKGIEDKLVELEEKSKGALEVKKALFEADGTIPDVVKAKILDAVEGDIGRLKTIITEAELIKAIQAKLNFAEIKNALIDKAFINQIISDEKFTQQFEEGQVTTQNIFTKLKDSIKSNISKEFITKEGVKKIVNDLTIDADGIRQITQQEITNRRDELKGKSSYLHKKYSDFEDGRNMSDNSTLKYIGIYTGDKEQAPTSASEYSWTKIKSDGKLYKAYSNSLNGLDFTLVEPDGNAKLFAKNRPRVNIVNNNDISDIWQANMFLSFKPNTKYTLTARAKGNSNKLWAYFRNNRTSEEYSWGQLEFRGLETKSITFTTTNDVEDVLFKFVLVPEDEDWTGIQIDWFTIYEGDKRYTDYPVNEPAQYQKYRYFGYVFKEDTPVASDFEWFDLQQTSITNDKYTHIVYSDNADGSNFGREPKKYMGVARTTSPTQPTDKTAYKWFKLKGEDGERGRDGVSNYIHRKYSDFSNGANMSDDSSLKYIGIYTGSSSTPPTTASSYLWSKIKGEDGANGTPGARGSDGRTPYFHTAYSNSSTGDRDFSTTDSTGKQYIGTYSDFEINDSNDYRRYKWVKIKGENGRDGRNGDSYARNYLSGTADEKVLTLTNNNYVTQEIFKLVENKSFRDLGFKIGDKVTFIADYEVLPNGNDKRINRLNFEWHDDTRFRVLMNFENNPTKGTYVATLTMNNDLLDCKRAIFRADNVNAKIKITNARLIQGDTVQPWSIAQEDLKGHTLTANMWFSGNYSNNTTNRVFLNLIVYYDGKEVKDYNVKVSYKGGGINNWRFQENAIVNRDNTINHDFWNDGEKDGTPLFALATVTYKGLQIVSDARLDNVPNVEEVKETIKRFKTFESTLEGFKSVIGEIKAKEIKAIVKTPNLCTEDFSNRKQGNDLYFNVSPNLKANTKYTIIVRAITVDFNVHQKTKVYGAKSGGGEQWLKSGYNVWVVDYATEQTRVNIYPLGNSSQVTKVEIYEGDYKEYIDKNNRFTSLGELTNYTTYYSYKINHNIAVAKGKFYLVRFDLATLPTDKWFSAGDGGTLLEYEWDFKKLNEELKLKDNEYIFEAHYNENFYIFHSTNSLKITNVRLYEVRFGVTLATQSSLVDISSMIDQSKDSIILSTKSEINDRLRNYPSHDYLNSNFANKRDIENLASKSELKILTNKIESTVTTGNIGTLLSQNAEEIIVAWNNYNKYFSFNNETLDIYENTAYQQRYKKLSLTSEGLKIYNNNTLIGTIGTFTHLGQSFRQNTLDIILTENTKAFGVYSWTDTWAFDTHLTGYMPLFEIKLENGLYKTNINTITEINDLYIRSFHLLSGSSTYTGVTKTINVGGRNLQFVQGILVSG